MVAAFRGHAGLAIGLVGALLALGAPSARAAEAERFASPTGRGAACAQAKPCTIKRALQDAKRGSAVTLEPGTYGSPTPESEPLEVGPGVTVHGQAGEARPLIVSEASRGITLEGEGSTLSDVEVQDSVGNYGVYADGSSGSSIDHAIVQVAAAGAVACSVSETLTDSVCYASGASAVAATLSSASSATATLRNDTLIASGSGGEALALHATGDTTRTIELVNSIAHGADFDILAGTESGGTPTAIVNANHSDYATTEEENGGDEGTISITAPGAAGNQTDAPVFTNEAGGDFHESASSSATIGEGANSALDGTTDLDGNPREILGVTDIGAYEFVPPPTCGPVEASTAFAQPVTIQLSCQDLAGAPLTYALVGAASHGAISVNATTGQAVYTPSPTKSGPDSFTYRASSRNGTAAIATVTVTVRPLGYHLPGPVKSPARLGAGSRPTPDVANLRESAKIWRAGRTRATISSVTATKKPPVGTAFSFNLNEAATVTLQFTEHASGRKVGRRCVAPTAKNRRARHCTRTITIGAIALVARAGANRVRFEGVISKHRKLKPGTYTVLVSASASGVRSLTRALHFTVVA